MKVPRLLLSVPLCLLLSTGVAVAPAVAGSDARQTNGLTGASSLGKAGDRSQITVDDLMVTLGSTTALGGTATLDNNAADGPRSDSSSIALKSAASSVVWKVSCTGAVDDPHYSSGAGGAIYKTRITCRGTGSGYPKTVAVTAEGGLGFTKHLNGAYGDRAYSKYTQTVTVNGGTVTFYTPKSGNGGRGTGYWLAASIWSFPGSTQGYVGKRVEKTI